MARNILGKFQTREFSVWKGMARENHLSAIYGESPQKASDLMITLMGYQRPGRTFEKLINSLPTKSFPTDDEYQWPVMGSTRENVALVEARDEAGTVIDLSYTGNVGAGTAPFKLVFPKDAFADGEWIVGNLNEAYQFRILGDGRPEGTNFVYDVELGGGNTEGCPVERLLPGELFSVEAAFAEREMSREMGDVRFASSAMMRNEFSSVRIKHKVPGKMLGKKVAFGVPVIVNNKPQVSPYWMHSVDYAVETQFSDYKNNALLFGKSNRNNNGEYMNIGKSGSAIKNGDGLYAQMAYGNTYYYTDFSLKLITDAIYYITVGQTDLTKKVYLLRTGLKGAEQFSKEVQKEASGWTMFAVNADALKVIERVNSNVHQTALAAGYQFVEFRAPMGITLKLDVDLSYDDPVRNKIEHPLGGPANSYRYDIMDLGEVGNENKQNIFKCVVENMPERRGYQWGPFANPFTGETNNMSASFDEDAAVIHKMATFGVCVLDPTRTMSIIPSVLQA